MILREAIQQIKGFRYMTEQLNVSSSLGRRTLLEMCWLTTEGEVEAELARIAEVIKILETREGKMLVEKIECRLMQIRDIRGTVKHTGEQGVLDDLELFELKNFALLADEVRELTEGWESVRIPDPGVVIALLDPEATRVPHFYISDAYSAELAALRADMKLRKQQGAGEKEIEQMYFRSVELEDAVREELSSKLRSCHTLLKQALEQVALLDIVIAKAQQALTMQLCRPGFSKEITRLTGLFNPQLTDILHAQGKQFQSVDVTLLPCATVITGANMAGKTVLLKSVALAQSLLQFGFYIPALQAEMVLVDEIQTSIGDDQDELNGLSSFAAEMLRINGITERIKSGARVLVLIDEPARTTNPLEGRAIVNGVVDFLTENKTMALVTTHYGGIVAACRKLRVKGFVEEKIQGKVTLKNINDFIDYSLDEDKGDEVPHEALRIASLLGINERLLERAEHFLVPEQSEHKIDRTVNS